MKKNVILLTIDTLRRDLLGCYGSNDGLSPFIDNIAKEGLMFSNYYTVAPYTQASFPGILTSSYYFDYDTVNNRLSVKRTLISEVLKKQGIVTAAFHSNPYLCAFFGWMRGWNTFYDSMQDQVTTLSPYIEGDIINNKVDNFLGNYKLIHRDKPFFLWVHYMDMHEPYIPKQEHIDKVDSSISLTNEEMFKLFKEVVLERDVSNAETVELLHKLYKAQICEIDEYIRDFFDMLSEHKVLEDSTVIITTDHGDEFGEHGSLSHDGKFYEELVHCPMIIYGTKENGENSKLASGLDISPTILSLFNLKPEPNFQGHSLLPANCYQECAVYGEAMGKLKHKIQPTDKPAFYCCNGSLKVTYRKEDDAWTLYDLQADPQEQHNIIDSLPQAEEMKKLLRPRIKRPYKQ